MSEYWAKKCAEKETEIEKLTSESSNYRARLATAENCWKGYQEEAVRLRAALQAIVDYEGEAMDMASNAENQIRDIARAALSVQQTKETEKS